MLANNLKIIIVESPYDTVQDPLVQSLFSQLIALKVEGYRTVYPYGVLPVDSHDFVATHHLACEYIEGKWVPLMGYKSVTLAKCGIHNLPFPGLNVLRSSNATTHEKTLMKILDQNTREGIATSYGSSWTIAPKARKDTELKTFLKEMMGGMLVLWEDEIQTKLKVCCGAPRIKTDQFFLNLGYERLSENGDILPPFDQTSLMGEPAVMLQCTRWSDNALALADKFKMMWRARMTLAAPKPDVAKKVA